MNKNYKLRFFIIPMCGIIATSFNGCSATTTCDITDNHAHKYQNDNGMILYIDDERHEYLKYKKTDDYVLINEDENKKIEKKLQYSLLKISDNMDYIKSLESKYEDFTEYRYYYAYVKSHLRMVGSTHYHSYTTEIGYSWTRDPNHDNLTGETRNVHYVFHGYELNKNKKGNYSFTKSKYYDNINEFLLECEYMRNEYVYVYGGNYETENFYKAYDGHYGVELQYDDGDENSHILSDEIMEKYKDELEKLEKEESLKYKK